MTTEATPGALGSNAWLGRLVASAIAEARLEAYGTADASNELEGDYGTWADWAALLERVAELAVAAERERCAAKAGEYARKWWAEHCRTNRHMATTRKAHEDFCALQAEIRRAERKAKRPWPRGGSMNENAAGQGPHERPVRPLCDEAQQDFEDALEVAFWNFDARRKGHGPWVDPQSERDAFKAECAAIACAYFDAKSVPLGFKVVPL